MVKQSSLQTKRIEKKEKKGPYGSWRKEFCEKYSRSIVQIQDNTQNSLVESLAEKGEMITCRKGCTHCCYHYVAVSLAHGIVIADHLYRKKALLKHFADNYEKWHCRGYSVADSIDCLRRQALASSMPIDRVIEDTRPLSVRYLDMNIQCPFLKDQRCLIYEVRPWSCSGHFSASPPEWCGPDTQQKPVIYNMTPGDEDLVEIMQKIDPRLMLYELSLPIMIHRLLTEGSSSMSEAP
jgi:hypothetical protein